MERGRETEARTRGASPDFSLSSGIGRTKHSGKHPGTRFYLCAPVGTGEWEGALCRHLHAEVRARSTTANVGVDRQPGANWCWGTLWGLQPAEEKLNSKGELARPTWEHCWR